MAYYIKSKEEFIKDLNIYLNENPLKPSYEENLINNFSSDKLSDLYKLFLDLKNSTLTSELCEKLYEKISNNFSLDIANELLTQKFNIKETMHYLEELIKDTFLNKDSSDMDSEEISKLSVIVNKIYPEVFLSFIEQPNNDIIEHQEIIKNKILSTIDHWHLHSTKSSEIETRDISGAIRITINRLYPNVHAYVLGRRKSAKSSISNIKKEIASALSKLIPSDLSLGLTSEDIENQFNLEGANSDFSGLTIVIDHVDDILHFDKNDFRTAEILKLRKNSLKNVKFSHALENFLQKNDFSMFSNIDLLQIKIDLLMRLRETTYEECTQEYNGTSFEEILKKTIEEYNSEIQLPEKSQMYDDLYESKIEEIYQLIDELKDRIYDKYQSKLFEVFIYDILDDPEFSDHLKVKSKFVKNVRKPNGFCAQYHSLETLDGKKIELQIVSKERFKGSKNGPYAHSLLPNKTIDICQFFEPIDEKCDEQQFKYHLDLLGNTTLATKNFLYNAHNSHLSSQQTRLKRQLKVAEQNIKLKDYCVFENIVDGVPRKIQYTLEEYLPLFAEYVSPELWSISSYHSRANTSIAGYNKKSLYDGFSDVLLKTDNTSCLAQILLDKLEELIPSEKNKLSLNGINKRAALRNTPKNISESNSDDEIER